MGPIIVVGEQFITLASDDALLELCHDDPTKFDAIHNHIQEELRDAFNVYMDAIASEINPPTGKMYAYMAAFHQFWMFRHIKFAQYLMALENAEQE